MPTPCFLIVPNGKGLLTLRRYSSASDREACPNNAGYGYHDASVEIGEVDLVFDERGIHQCYHRSDFADDPRWPAVCEHCGYAFVEEDNWQANCIALYRRADGSSDATWTLAYRGDRAAPPGAMWDAEWLHDMPGFYFTGEDGRILMCRVPDNHDWCIDGRANNGPQNARGWTRTGVPPCVTAHPSIATPGYHGFLRDGILTDDLEGRTYP